MVKPPEAGYSLLVLMVGISLLLIGMMIAMPVLSTQARREKEAELLFRGAQYVEAVRLYVRNNPGHFPESIEDLVEKRYLRRAFPDPMTRDGKWNLILMADRAGVPSAAPAASLRERSQAAAGRRSGRQPSRAAAAPVSVQRVMVVPESSIESVAAPRIIGVVSSSAEKSFSLFDENETYDTWLFYYGRTKGAKPEIIRFGASDKK